MRDPADLQHADNWAGGFYELGLGLTTTDDTSLGLAARRLARLTGIDSHDDAASVAAGDRMRGVLSLPVLGRTVAQIYALRALEPTDRDWLCLGLPLAALERADPRIGGFPFGTDGGRASLDWRTPIDAWLLRLARTIAAELAVRMAVVGFELLYDEIEAAVAQGPPTDRPWSLFLPKAEPDLLPATY